MPSSCQFWAAALRGSNVDVFKDSANAVQNASCSRFVSVSIPARRSAYPPVRGGRGALPGGDDEGLLVARCDSAVARTGDYRESGHENGARKVAVRF